MILRRTTCLLWLVLGNLQAASLEEKIQTVIDTAPGLTRGYLGLQIVDLATDTVVYANNADRLFVPASN